MNSALATLLMLVSTWATAQEALQLDDLDHVSLTPHLAYYHDASGGDDLATAVDRMREGSFRPMPGGSTAFGFQPGAFWFHARVVNRSPTEPRWLLVQRYALSDHVDMYLRDSQGNVTHQAGGDALPFDARSIQYRHPNFWLQLPTDQPMDLFVRVQSQSSMQVPFSLYTPAAFTERSRDAQFIIGLYYGILLALFFYNLVLWLTLRDPSYVWYLLHISAFGLVLFTLNGLGFEYLWPNSSWLADKAVPLSICLAQIGMQQFARHFLELRRRWRFGDRVGLGMIGFFVMLGVASTQLPYRISTPIASAAVFLSITWIAIASLVVLMRGYKPARLFLLAWAMFLLGTGIFTALAFGLLPKNFLTEYGVQIGSALEMLLLSVALGYRYASLRNENERIVDEAKQQLEKKVEQRTGELRDALGQLGDAHARLRETSQRDGLTGLHTRTYFSERFENLLVQAQRSDELVSLLMIDLDNFKAINDHYGHLTGDECLRWAARTIGQALRPYGALLARFGGEEFIVGLPGMGLQAAAVVADILRQKVREAPCSSCEHEIQITISVGVHQVDLNFGGIDAALQRADEALYDAKAHGRDCVRLASPSPDIVEG
ncbi:MAG TPA: diguanylate cyclase [Lysobacter sp.]|nr:diguanylate cyclase [Lysobacter sp.]